MSQARFPGRGQPGGPVPGPAAPPPEEHPDRDEAEHGEQFGPQVGEPFGVRPALRPEVVAEPVLAQSGGDELDGGDGDQDHQDDRQRPVGRQLERPRRDLVAQAQPRTSPAPDKVAAPLAATWPPYTVKTVWMALMNPLKLVIALVGKWGMR